MMAVPQSLGSTLSGQASQGGIIWTPLTTLMAIFDTGIDKVPGVAEVHAILDGHVVRVRIADR